MASLHDLIILSDVHLGSDLVHHARPDAPLRPRASERRDRELAALLDWYRENRSTDRPWKLVIAGDFVDFVGMSISPGPDVRTPLTEDERSLGLGAAVDHSVAKLRSVARHHRDVFRGLAQFVAAGNTLVVVRGNHDVDFHWRRVQDEFVRQLAVYAHIDRGRIEFAPWFYYEEGRVYVEHGHQYDRYCVQEHVLHPLSPTDPRRLWRSLSDLMLRYVVRPTRGMTESGHEDASVADYLAFAIRLGRAGMVSLVKRFVVASVRAVALWRNHFSDGARRIREHHRRRMADLAAFKDLSLERLEALQALQCVPITRSLAHVLATLMLDRLLLLVLGLVLFATSFAVVDPWHDAALFSGVALLSLALAGWLWARSRVGLDPSHQLRAQAARVARVFPATFVVMGHTHMPEVSPSEDGESTYVNLGAWSEEDSDDGMVPTLPATRTHLVVRESGDGSVAELMTWDSEAGPRRFVTYAVDRSPDV